MIRLEIESRVKRCGLEMRLVFSPRSHWQGTVSASLVLKAVARGRTRYEWILAEEFSAARAIAQKLSLNERYVRRVLECAFLALDIMEAILDGRQPLISPSENSPIACL